MNKKLIIAVILVTLVFAAAGVGTMAWFTSQVTSTENTFQTGTLALSGSQGQQFASLVVSDMQPGMPVHEGSTILRNNGTLPLKLYRINTGNIVDPDGLDEVLDIEVFVGATSVYTGKLSQLVSGNGGYFNPIMNVPAGQELELKLVVTMSEDANNDYQGKELTTDFTVHAAQENMPLPGEEEGWTQIASSNGGASKGFNIDGRNTNNAVQYRFNWRQNTGILAEMAEIYVKHQTGDVDSQVQLIRILWNTSKIEVQEGHIEAHEVNVNWSRHIVSIDKSAFPNEWEIIDVKFGGIPSLLDPSHYTTDFVGWHLDR